MAWPAIEARFINPTGTARGTQQPMGKQPAQALGDLDPQAEVDPSTTAAHNRHGPSRRADEQVPGSCGSPTQRGHSY